MRYILKEMSKEELPREKLKKYGAHNLSDYELLAIIIKSGIKDKSVLDISIEIMKYFDSLYSLEDCTIDELTSIKGIGEAKALEIIAVMELSKRMISKKSNDTYIYSAKDAYNYLLKEFVGLKQEHFFCLYLNNRQKVICYKLICVGTDKETLLDTKNALKWALRHSAAMVIFMHNHPSGDVRPSKADYISTDKLRLMCDYLGLEYLDHIIVGDNCYYSFKKNKIEKN